MHLVIAIDGPAASGKSSVARALAYSFGFAYINTGAMYRAATWQVLRRGVDPLDEAAVAAAMEASQIVTGLNGLKESTITLDGDDPTPFLRDEAINHHVSNVSTVPRVRELLVARQRAYAERDDIVMEGRDIGSAVFPQTPYKFYVDASPEVRAQRRAAQGEGDSIAQRDRIDSTRRASPLMIAEDAQVIDSSRLTIEGVVGEIIGRLKLKRFPLPPLARLTRE
ncbi:MAG: (d)CMP kinase [Verrucomicrobia bacterium]|nr:(d)CMP kinase [Verrucomicrobiota bacterium]